ncbi:unnamed protein product [Blepharisma stoltei]|uniref:RING-CH-type domain-containing protein n=1 Tax=Blepharisma stoltei TaxID=1481888 RepID=A0AAU9JTP2_9CILI|nr:unnamed protein product [Blepharisma stoltei]
MSECRICLNSSNDSALISPCMCSGSIKYVHSHCLQHWLKEKYPNRYKTMPIKTRGCNTGLKCELCKYEFQGKLRFLGISGILKKLKETQALIYIILNVPVVLYLIYKFNYLLRHLLNVSKSHINLIKLQSSGCKKIFMLTKFYIRFLLGLLPVAVFGASAPTIAYSTMVLAKNLISECQVFEIKSISGKMQNQLKAVN